MKQKLLKKYQFSLDYTLFLYDLAIHIVDLAEKKKVFEVSYLNPMFHNNTDIIDKKLTAESLWNCLENKNPKMLLYELARKQIFHALLADLFEYMHESLDCISESKISLAYTLLRRPLKDNLFVLEWILADPNDFSDTFHNKKVEELSISDINQAKKLHIIKNAISKSYNSDWIDSEFIYELRYSKASLFGYEGVWNKALHLITTNKHYKTESENLNYVFTKDDETEVNSLMRFYFRALPILMNHLVEIVYSFVTKNIELNILSDSLLEAKRRVGMILWLKDFFNDKNHIKLFSDARVIFKNMDLKCGLCKRKISFEKNNLLNYFYTSGFTCKYCKTYIQLNLLTV